MVALTFIVVGKWNLHYFPTIVIGNGNIVCTALVNAVIGTYDTAAKKVYLSSALSPVFLLVMAPWFGILYWAVWCS